MLRELSEATQDPRAPARCLSLLALALVARLTGPGSVPLASATLAVAIPFCEYRGSNALATEG